MLMYLIKKISFIVRAGAGYLDKYHIQCIIVTFYQLTLFSYTLGIGSERFLTCLRVNLL